MPSVDPNLGLRMHKRLIGLVLEYSSRLSVTCLTLRVYFSRLQTLHRVALVNAAVDNLMFSRTVGR